jgi:hypothetical protein
MAMRKSGAAASRQGQNTARGRPSAGDRTPLRRRQDGSVILVSKAQEQQEEHRNHQKGQTSKELREAAWEQRFGKMPPIRSKPT